MRRDRENKETQRVTRRAGTRVDGDIDAARDDAREPSYRDEYAYVDERDERRYRDERDDRRYRDERDERRYRDERDDRRYRDERDERRYRDERDDRRDDRRDRRAVEPREQKGQRSVTRSSRATGYKKGGNPDRTIHQLLPYALFCLSVFSGVSFFLRDFVGFTDQTDWLGNLLPNFLCGLLGVIAYALPVFMFIWALRWRSYVKHGQLLKKLLLSGAFLVLLSGIVHVFRDATRGTLATDTADLYHNGVARVGGGLFGGFAGEWIGYVLRLPGTIILAIPLLIIVAIYLIGMTPSGLWQRITCKFSVMQKKHEERRAAMYDGTKESPRKEKAQSRPVKEQGPIAVAKWSEPHPLEQSVSNTGVFSFSDEEDEPIVLQTPFARSQPRANESAPQSAEAPVATPVQPETPTRVATSAPVAEPAAPEAVLRETMREQVSFEPAPAAQPAGSAYTTPFAQPAAPTAQPAATAQPEAEHSAKSGQVFAPFALPVQPFPERGSHAASAHSEAASPATATSFAATASTAAAATVSSSAASTAQTEEVLGAVAPASRPAASYAAPAAASTSRVTTTATFFNTPVTPVAKEEPLPKAFEPEQSFAKKDPVQPFSVFTSEEKEPTAKESFASEESAFTFETPQKQVPTTEDAPGSADKLRYADEAYQSNDIIGEDEEDEDEFYAPAAPAAGTVSFDREYVAPAKSAPTYTPPVQSAPAQSAPAWDAVQEKEPDPTPIPVQTVRVEPQPAPAYVPPAPTYTPPVQSTRVAVKAEPVKSEPAQAEPVIVEYKRPPIDLLNEDKNVRTDDFYEEIEETKDILRQTMASFNIRIQDEINYSHGPSVTRYEMRPVAGTSVRSVTNRTEDIALNLASSVRIEAPIPGKPAIGIEVPNKVRETVYMRTMLESPQFKNSADPLDVPLGLDVGGDVRMCNLAKMPHLLVAGTTGSGKSVCINSILVSLIYKTSPEDLRLILIDPKQIEFAPYEDVPHLYMPIVTDMQRASGALACAVQEMERRFSLIKDVGVRNIEAYNEAVRNDPDREHLPYIIIVIDEFADLKMSCNNNDPENFTCRIAQKARAAGIHLIIGTQRPSVDVITGKLKTNIPSRIAFMVKQQVDSRTILDANGAESLTGRGDMLYMPTNSNDKQPVRIQGAFVSDGELERVISYVRRNNAPVQYNRAFMDQIELEMARAAKADRKGDDYDYANGEEEGGEDPKFVEAVELSIQAQKVATSLLQRRLGVGYGRAAKIIDRMEELGLVSPAEGNKPRKILPTAQGYLEHIGAMSADGEDDFGDDYG